MAHNCPLCGAAGMGIATLDGFNESLRLLIEDERYALRDIAQMFDVSGERVRQLAKKAGIETERRNGLCDCRLWDDTAHRFIPVRRSELARRRERAKRQRRRAEYAAKWDAREALAVARLKSLAATLGRVPTLYELGEAMGLRDFNVGRVPAMIERHKNAREIWRRAGLEMLAPGYRTDETSRRA